MADGSRILILRSLTSLLSLLCIISPSLGSVDQVYIVKTNRQGLLAQQNSNPSLKEEGAKKTWKNNQQQFQNNIISSSLNNQRSPLYYYTTVMNGFSVSLNEDEAKVLQENPNVEFVVKSRTFEKSTTYTPQYMGLQGGKNPVWKKTTGKDIIIAFVDTGAWPESASFKDTGLKDVPSKFNGICDQGVSGPPFTCNKKLIGARYFVKGFEAYFGMSRSTLPDNISPRDTDGHGSHVASTGAGAPAPNASISSFDFGTAIGVARDARIVVYKVFWWPAMRAVDSDIIAAFEAGVEDGVDVFSLSLGSDMPVPVYFDAILLSAISVVQANIPVVFAAGNAGYGTVANSAPWVLTVGASYVDRSFSNSVVLSDGRSFQGYAINNGTKGKALYPLVDAEFAGVNDTSNEFCFSGRFDAAKVNGKVVLCQRGINGRVEKSVAVKNAGGVGMIMYNQAPGLSLDADFNAIPSSHVENSVGIEIKRFILNTKSPKARITLFVTNIGNGTIAPQVVSFSSTGPNIPMPYIIKPDIIAPGVGIIAATSESPYSSEPLKYNFYSGTSMATPHIAGVVALIKSVYPSWTPSRIYSAITTTGLKVNNQGKPIQVDGYGRATPWDMGGGFVNANGALDPGLVYDLNPSQYTNFLCTQSGGYYLYLPLLCLNGLLREIDFNFPYLALPFLTEATTVNRTLTLVGTPGTFKVEVVNPVGATIVVTPRTLVFKRRGEKLSYVITVTPMLPSYFVDGVDYSLQSTFTFGNITWSSRYYSVPINVAVSVK